MAPKYWLGTTDAVYSTAANWAATSGGAPGDGKPGIGDDVFFDSAGDNACTLDEATAAINSLTVVGGGTIYTATLNFNGHAVNVTGGDDMTFDGSGTVDCGASTITCSGNFDNKDQGTWTRGTSTLVMDGVSKTIISATANRFNSLTISGTISTAVGSSGWVGAVNLTIDATKSLTLDFPWLGLGFGGTYSINGTLVCAAIFVDNASSTVTVGASGNVTGASTFQAEGATITNTAGGTWDVAATTINASSTISGEFGGTVAIRIGNVGNFTFLFAGNTTFLGNVRFDAHQTTKTFIIDAATNDVSIEFQGDVDLQEVDGTATLEWQKPATGSVTFGGTTTYTDNTAAIQNLGDVEVDGTSLTLASDMECDDFDGTSGTLYMNGANTLDVAGNMDWAFGFVIADPVGATFEVAGNFTADAQDISGASGEWFLQVGVSAVVLGLGKVKNSNAGGFTEIDATAGPWEDTAPGGTNTNWNFGAPPAEFTSRNIIVGGGVI